MHTAKLLLLVLTFAPFAVDGQDTNTPGLPTTITIDDFTYQDVQWGKPAPCIMILHKGGTAYIPLAKLPGEVRNRLVTNPDDKPAATNTIHRDQPPALVPAMSDEIQFAVVAADPAQWLNKVFVVRGVATNCNIFLYGSTFGAQTHDCLKCDQPSSDPKSAGSLIVYAKKELAGPLMESVANASHSGQPAGVRLKVTITSSCFVYGKFGGMTELVDWQTLKDDRQTWTDWALHPAPASP